MARAERRLDLLSDLRVAALTHDGDDAAFEVLVHRHRPALLALCRHLLRSREDGEDALQQTLFRAHEALRRGPPPRDVRPWLFAIARNRCRSLLAARARAPVPAGGAPDVPARGDDPSARSAVRELVEDVLRLPEEQRRALVLSEFGDLSHAQIARELGCPVAKVRSLVFQARTRLRRRRAVSVFAPG